MAVDAQTGVLDTAWGQIPHSPQATAGIGSFTRSRVERIISLVGGAFGSLILGLQAFLAALGSTDERPGWHEALMISVFGTLAVMILACVIGRGVRVAAGVFALVYVLALVAWPIATAGVMPTTVDEPWIWYLVNLATLAAVLAFPFPLQIGWTILAPVLFGLVRLMQVGFDSDYWMTVGLDVSFALILGGVILTLGWLFRSIAVNVDETRARAVASYAQAAAADAAEQERVAVAALMHDSVLAALIAAERASTPRERTLAASMAREALTRLANTEQDAHEGTDEPWEVAALAAEIDAAAAELGVDVDVQREFDDAASLIPGRVARALALAATQAVANALQHAGGAGLGVAVMETHGRVRVEVHDAGEGFDLDAVPDDRLGIRASIMARVAAVGGHADLETGPHGTVVRLTWQESAA
ncbi:ATP-binding protein [Microbacterium sp. QXD-8]|uniref:ATP-binding protein n=1 Tax=Microbacterium psychrotolerans TaxID=3068321 RepID=A0ABU0Z2F3_9MICO|nr:ATP-binding protein [Microbacterium sp. QXD-8]MDQ7878732.1 ATP-binding protein [Microbacterium sp. QXD-8]